MKKQLILIVMLVFLPALMLHGQNNVPDSLFGNNSILFLDPGTGDVGSNFLVQPDGLIIYGGYDYNISANDFHNDMVRFDECGLVDSTFGTNGYVHHKFDQRNQGYVYHLQQDGKILCGGTQASSNAGSQQFPFIARYNADGSVDTNFATGGSFKISFDNVSAGSVHSIGTLPDGRIVCIGSCFCGGGGVMRFLPDGTLDSTFSIDGKVSHTFPNASAFSEVYGYVLQNGNTVLVGATWDGSFIDHFVSYCFDSTGVLDTTYGISGFFNDTTLLDVYIYGLATAIQPNEKIIMVANRPSLGGIEVVRINSTGTIDNTFGTGGHVSFQIPGTQSVKTKVLNNGQIMVMGIYQPANSAFGILLNSNGTVDSTFGQNGFRIFNMNNGQGNGGLIDLLELPTGEWLAGTTASNGLQVVKYANQSDVPHISQNVAQLQTTGTGTYQWFFNGNILPGANANTYNFTQNGIYTVLLTDTSGCSYLSDPYTVTNTNLMDLKLNDLTILPNPSNGNFVISFEKTITNGSLEIFNTLGKSFFNEKISNETRKEIFLENISNGIYSVKMFDGDKHLWGKVMMVIE